MAQEACPNPRVWRPDREVEIERILIDGDGDGADRQRRALESGALPAVLEYLAAATDAD